MWVYGGEVCNTKCVWKTEDRHVESSVEFPLLPTWRFWGSNSGCQACMEMLYSLSHLTGPVVACRIGWPWTIAENVTHPHAWYIFNLLANFSQTPLVTSTDNLSYWPSRTIQFHQTLVYRFPWTVRKISSAPMEVIVSFFACFPGEPEDKIWVLGKNE